MSNMTQVLENVGAGEGNRTLVISLEGCCSTIELHPQNAKHFYRKSRPVCVASQLRRGSFRVRWLPSRSPPSRSHIQAGLPAEARRFGGRRLVGEVGLEPTKA